MVVKVTILTTFYIGFLVTLIQNIEKPMALIILPKSKLNILNGN